MAKYQEQTRYSITDLTDKEFSVVVAGLASLVTQGEMHIYRYPEYREQAEELLRVVNPALLRGIEQKREEERDAQAR